MFKRIIGGALAVMMAFSLVVMPTYAASFSEDNKRKNAYDITLNGDSNFIQWKDNGYEKNCLQVDQLSFDYDHTNAADGMKAGEVGNFYTKNRAKFKGATVSSKYMLSYRWKGGIMGRAADGSTVKADLPVFVHQRLHIAWYAQKMTRFDFFPYCNDSFKESTGAGFTFYKADGGSVDTYAPKSEWSMLKYGESKFKLTTSANTPIFNTIDVIYDYTNGHKFAMYLFIEGKLVGISKPSTNIPDKFYGWTTRSDETFVRQNDYIEILGDEETGWGHTEYVEANGYYPTLEDVMQDQGLMTEEVTDSTVMMKTTALSSYMPPASANTHVNDVKINEDVSYLEDVAIISHKQSDTSTEEIAAHMLQGIISPNNSGLVYSSYHPRAKYVKLSFDQKINSGTVAYKLCYNTNRTDSIQFWKDNGFLYASVRGGGGNNYLNGANGRATAKENGTNRIDWVLEFHENEEDKNEGGVIHYLFCNGEYVGQGKVGNHNLNRIADITVETKGTENPEVEISNWSMTFYNDKATYEAIESEIMSSNSYDILWDETAIFDGTGLNDTCFSLGSIAVAKNEVAEGARLYTAIYGSDGRMLDSDVTDFVSGKENETKLFKKQYDGVRPTYARMYVWSGLEPLAAKKTVAIPPNFTDDDIYVLAIGNSFSQDAVSKLLEIAQADGISIISYNAYKAGRPLKDHYSAWVNSKNDYRVEPYGVSNGQTSTPQGLAQMHNWDFVMLQGTTHFNSYDEGLWGADEANTELYWSTLAEGIESYAPNAKRLVHATWSPMNERIQYLDVIGEELANGTPDPMGAYLTALLPHQQVGADLYSTEKRADGENAYIPTAVAIDYLIRYYRFPEYEGERDADNKYDNSETTRGVYRDTTCHLTDNVGRVLAGLVWFEMITGIPATESSYTRNTLSVSDMRKLKEAAHYACQNYATYDPEKIVAPTTETVSAVITPSKNGADSTVVFVHDDANRATSKYLLEEFEKYNLYGTAGVWGEKIDNISDEAMADWKNIFANGRLGVSSHSYTHNYMGESDEAESGTLKDGSSYSFEAGHMTKNIANERVRLNGLFEGHRVLTFIKPGTSYPEGKEQVSAAAKQMIKDNYIGMRNTGGGIEEIPPSDTYSVKSLMAKVGECELDSWLSNLESVVKRKGMLVYLFHNIDDVETPKGQQTSRADVSVLLEEMGELAAANKIWSAQFDEAMQYAKEYGANAKAEVVIDYVNKNLKVTVTDNISKADPLLDNGREMYDYPLTVKVEVPFNWASVKLTQDYYGREEIVETFKENGTRYVYANVVPDQGSAYLVEASK